MAAAAPTSGTQSLQQTRELSLRKPRLIYSCTTARMFFCNENCLKLMQGRLTVIDECKDGQRFPPGEQQQRQLFSVQPFNFEPGSGDPDPVD